MKRKQIEWFLVDMVIESLSDSDTEESEESESDEEDDNYIPLLPNLENWSERGEDNEINRNIWDLVLKMYGVKDITFSE